MEVTMYLEPRSDKVDNIDIDDETMQDIRQCSKAWVSKMNKIGCNFTVGEYHSLGQTYEDDLTLDKITIHYRNESGESQSCDRVLWSYIDRTDPMSYHEETAIMDVSINAIYACFVKDSDLDIDHDDDIKEHRRIKTRIDSIQKQAEKFCEKWIATKEAKVGGKVKRVKNRTDNPY
jgi:hypothetical protein